MVKRLSNFFKYNKTLWVLPLVSVALLALNLLFAQYVAQLANLAFTFFYLFLFMGFQIFIWIYLFFFILAGQVKIVLLMPGDIKLRWADYVGQDPLVERAKKWVEVLRGVSEFEAMGGQYQPGVLFEGPPGGGKTYLAKVIASEAGIPFLSVDAASLMGTFIGIGPMKVGRLFKQARNLAEQFGSSILFIDEIDAIGGSRGGVTASDPAESGIRGFADRVARAMVGMPMGGGGSGLLNTLLIELDGLSEGRGRLWRLARRILLWLEYGEPVYKVPRLMVIGSTNRPDVLDPALTRPGRLGLKIAVRKPQHDGLVKVCQYYIDAVQHDETFTAELVAFDSQDETPAFVKQTINSAVLAAFQTGAKLVGYRHWTQVLAEAKMGGIRQPQEREEEDLVSIAVHEAAHAAIMWHTFDPTRHKVRVATIIPYGPAGGHVAPQKVRPVGRETIPEVKNILVHMLGGTVAEEVLLGVRRHYPSDFGDMRNAQLIALELSRAGAFGWEFSLILPYQEVPQKLQDMVATALKEADAKAREMIAGPLRKPILRLATALIEKGELFGDDIIETMNLDAEIDPRIAKYLKEKMS